MKVAISEMVLNIAETDINCSEMFIEGRAKRRYDKMDNGMDIVSLPVPLSGGAGGISQTAAPFGKAR